MTRDILLALIDPDPRQNRKTFDEGALDELAQSMAENGLAVPVLVRPGQDGRYVLVHGERRWRAAGRLGWAAIPAEVRDVAPEQARWLALVENIQRADLSPIEEAGAYQAALSEGLTQTELGKRIGKSQSYIAQKLRLLTLPAPLQVYLDRRALSEGHARQLLRLRNFYGPDLPAAAGRWQEAWAPCLDAAYWQEACMVFALLRDLRPLDQPVYFADLLTDKNEVPAVLSAGCHAFSTWWAEIDQVAQWAAAAFWYGSFVAHYGVSVVDLKAHLDQAESILYSAVAWLDGREEAPLDELGKLSYWSYRADLRHSGLTDPPRQMLWDAIGYTAKTDFFAAPSNCQPYGENGALWAELSAKQDDLTDELGMIGGRSLSDFWQELAELRGKLDEVQDLPEVKAIIDQAADLQREAGVFHLDNARAAGQAMNQLKALEALKVQP